MVLSTGQGVHGFTLDPVVGEFFLSHPNIALTPNAKLYSVNESYAASWDPRLRAYIEGLKNSQDGWNSRYIGSLVADFHRNILKGGIFMYPGTTAKPKGKLRLLYEAFPMAFLAEAAGGAATDGQTPILDRMPTDFHERTPLFVGNADNVSTVTQILKDQ